MLKKFIGSDYPYVTAQNINLDILEVLLNRHVLVVLIGILYLNFDEGLFSVCPDPVYYPPLFWLQAHSRMYLLVADFV